MQKVKASGEFDAIIDKMNDTTTEVIETTGITA